MVLKIAIIGAGPAGCCLARLLHVNNKDIDVTIFESEANLDYRSQGGTLDLRTGSGLDAIKAAGLWDVFSPHARYDGEALKVADKNFLCYLSMSGSKEHKDFARPEIDRPVLRRILFESLPEGVVEWGHKLAKIDQDMTLHFTDKPSRSGYDLIVGADGAWSKTRARVSELKPFYSGIGGHSIVIPDAATKHKELYDLVNRGSIFSYSDGKSIMPQQMGDGSINVGVWSTRPENWQQTTSYDPKNNDAIRAFYADYYKDWDPRLVAFTQQSDSEFTARDLFMLLVGTHWEHVRGVTLIGDAAHLATPFAGIGVNTALADALKLAQAIISAKNDKDPSLKLDQSVKAFEVDMFKRAKVVQEDTAYNMQFMFFGDKAPRDGIEEFILHAIRDELGWFTHLLRPLVYTYYFFFKRWHRV